MYAFVDESGDIGFKEGSSKFLTIASVGFESIEDMLICTEAIQSFKDEVGLKKELHFFDNAEWVKRRFLEEISECNFFFYGLVVNKRKVDSPYLSTPPPEDSMALYKLACRYLFNTIRIGNGRKVFEASTVVFDKSGNRKFQHSFKKELKRHTRENSLNIQMKDSDQSNLLQLADYVVGSINKALPLNKGQQDISYVSYILKQIKYVRIWPLGGEEDEWPKHPSLRKYWEGLYWENVYRKLR